MAATDRNYRNQKILDIVFAVTCLLMFFSIMWMLYDDFNRPFKQVQRKFRDVETGIFESAMLDKLPSPEQMDQIKENERQIDTARAAVKEQKNLLKQKLTQYLDGNPSAFKQYADNPERWIKHQQTTKTNLQNEYQGYKSKIDSKSSFYNEEMDKAAAEKDERLRREHEDRAANLAKDIDKHTADLNETRRKIDDIDSGLDIVQGDLKKAQDQLTKLEDDLKKMTNDFDRLAKTTAQKTWKAGDWIRGLPILDGFASPTKPNQITLKALPIDYGGFSDVTRFDRCTTCHLGIDRFNFDKDSLEKLVQGTDERQKKLEAAHKFLVARQKRLAATDEDLGFDPNDLPTKATKVKLSKSEIMQYAAHPRLDLFVDPNSKHPMETFGCTSCHAGQGSATDFVKAAHTPATVQQMVAWKDHHDWESSHDWEFPMHSSRFIESTCVKCHHQITDLITHGNREEAPKLLRGFNLVKENGCFGCHEIAGIKSGRAVGPDLRLEPNPPLDELSPEERAKANADPLNPPGVQRKVGPSLYRINEKTNEKWARSWLNDPRGFRADTKMPHFYGLSTNSPDMLPADQKEFPAAEVSSIISYIFDSSKDYLSGNDFYREFNLKRRKELTAALTRQEPPLTDFEKKKIEKELSEVNDRLKYAKVPKALKDLTKKDGERTTELAFNEKGDEVVVPKAPVADAAAQHLANGRRLFTEKGCLACHAHQGTAVAQGNEILAVDSDANFGPNLSRLSAKLDKSNRHWLVQWILNPNMHWSRTRMPNLHLTPLEAADIADWLLSQPAGGDAARIGEVANWNEADVPEPSLQTLADLARVYLLKAPGMTQVEVDQVLGGKNDVAKGQGISAERAEFLPADADERRLKGPLNKESLKWYIGKKSIGRMGCYGCHNIPGFEAAKPIGTALNDWGKKDPERLAFEQADDWVKGHHKIVQTRADETHKNMPSAEWTVKDGVTPYEQYYFDALEHRQREGFLHQKLSEPRSFDYARIRTWDDRLRMPQFRFGRPKPLPNESREAFLDRASMEEDEAREAVMTFILGLVAEPVPLTYVNQPKNDRLAEVRGRQVLDKFNCAGCHQIQPGIYDYKLDTDAIKLLGRSLTLAKPNMKGDHKFPEDNAWVGPVNTDKDRLRIFGVNPREDNQPINEGDADTKTVQRLRLARALRITDGNNNLEGDLPAGEDAFLLPGNIATHSEAHGGIFANLLTPYLKARYSSRLTDDAKARSTLPPPLEREGERAQPGWLFGFLRNPEAVRPTNWMMLRMPRFNMSDDDAMALVNYFAAFDRLENAGVGLTAPYLTIPQRDDHFWTERNRQYAAQMGKAKLIEWTKVYLAELKERNKAGKSDELEKGIKNVEELLAKLEKIKEDDLKKADASKDEFAGLRNRVADLNPYAVDGFRLLVHKQSPCLECHRVGPVPSKGDAQGPPLELTAERLRPEWTQRWLANPARLFTYPPNMPANFPSDRENFRDIFDGLSIDQLTALRDVLMNLPKVADLPANREFIKTAPGPK
jgi:mono/diheme cytochrome c family protein